MKKRFISVITVIAVCLSAAVFCRADTQSYWSWQPRWLEVYNTDNYDAIISLVKELENIYPAPSDSSQYARLETPLKKCAAAYEYKGMYSSALSYYKKYLSCIKWINEHESDRSDAIRGAAAIIEYLENPVTLYAEADVKNAPYYGAVNEPEYGTYVGMSGNDTIEGEQNGKLIYVHFFNETIRGFDYLFPTDESYVVEVAWNVPEETKSELDTIAAGEWDDYIKADLEYLRQKGCRVLLRFGAEVNVWKDLPQTAGDAAAKKDEYCKSFKAAFRKIASLAHSIAPNCAMVFSPNDISNWYFDATDFYPGDEYVDWVGLSSYGNIAAGATGSVGDGADAVFCRGRYDDQMLRIKRIADAFGDRKPIMISECGFAYAGSNQTHRHALEQMRYFYTYINMVFPQVKAVFYFNTNYRDSDNKYKLTGDDGDYEMLELYKSMVRQNAPMQALLGKNGKSYVPLDSLSGDAADTNITAYVRFPAGDRATVSYSLDGGAQVSTAEYPYNYSISKSALTEGIHTLKVDVVCRGESITRTYGIFVDSDGEISTFVSKMSDVAPKSWYYDEVAYCLHHGIFNGTDADKFSPDSNMNRAMLVTVLWRLEGEPSVYGETGFSDVKDGRYYTEPVRWAKTSDIVKGVDSTHFKPDDGITREQLATILFRYAAAKGRDTTARAALSGFPDAGKVSDYAKDALAWSYASGLITGSKNGNAVYLDPRGNASRAQVATILMRFNGRKSQEVNAKKCESLQAVHKLRGKEAI